MLWRLGDVLLELLRRTLVFRELRERIEELQYLGRARGLEAKAGEDVGIY